MERETETTKTNSSLRELKKHVTQEHIRMYASASGDFNPVHIDPEFAVKAGLGGTIAHGMMILAYVYEFMANSFGQDWQNGGNIDARFKTPARPGDTITVNGKISRTCDEDKHNTLFCDIICQNQHGEPVIVCEAKVKVRANENRG